MSYQTNQGEALRITLSQRDGYDPSQEFSFKDLDLPTTVETPLNDRICELNDNINYQITKDHVTAIKQQDTGNNHLHEDTLKFASCIACAQQFIKTAKKHDTQSFTQLKTFVQIEFSPVFIPDKLASQIQSLGPFQQISGSVKIHSLSSQVFTLITKGLQHFCASKGQQFKNLIKANYFDTTIPFEDYWKILTCDTQIGIDTKFRFMGNRSDQDDFAKQLWNAAIQETPLMFFLYSQAQATWFMEAARYFQVDTQQLIDAIDEEPFSAIACQAQIIGQSKLEEINRRIVSQTALIQRFEAARVIPDDLDNLNDDSYYGKSHFQFCRFLLTNESLLTPVKFAELHARKDRITTLLNDIAYNSDFRNSFISVPRVPNTNFKMTGQNFDRVWMCVNEKQRDLFSVAWQVYKYTFLFNPVLQDMIHDAERMKAVCSKLKTVMVPMINLDPLVAATKQAIADSNGCQSLVQVFRASAFTPSESGQLCQLTFHEKGRIYSAVVLDKTSAFTVQGIDFSKEIKRKDGYKYSSASAQTLGQTLRIRINANEKNNEKKK